MKSLSRVIKPEYWQFGKPMLVTPTLADQPAPAGGEAGAVAAPPAETDSGRGGPVSSAPVVDTTGAERQAAEILAEARARAEELIDEAVSGAERLVADSRKSGYDEGRREGYQTGISAAQAEVAALRLEAEELLRTAQAERERQLSEVQADVAQLAMTVAEKIVRRRLDDDPELVVGIVADAISRARNGETLRVRANPHDIPIIQDRESALVASVAGLKDLQLIEDPGIAPGGCLVETGHGYIDARIDRQLELVEEALRTAVGHGR